jgi:hypothetical protein
VVLSAENKKAIDGASWFRPCFFGFEQNSISDL